MEKIIKQLCATINNKIGMGNENNLINKIMQDNETIESKKEPTKAANIFNNYITNYRPISTVSNEAKIFERVVKSHQIKLLYITLITNSALQKNQAGKMQSKNNFNNNIIHLTQEIMNT